ncbi:MAG: peptide ABC transporter substrate-binding protein [Bacillota bacterium]|nr:peptide ABC transporter substrate-binding protein [Bacillota bacterium]
MKKVKVVSVYILLLFCSTFLLNGCSEKKQKVSNEKPVLDKYQYINATLKDEPRTLDPSNAVDVNSKTVLANVMEGLTRLEIDKDGNQVIKPAGAESWDVSSDGLTWTFHLKKNNWSDGTAVSAKDYVYGVKRTLDPKTNAIDAVLLSPIKNSMSYNNNRVKEDTVGVKAIDDNTLQFNLGYKCPYFLSLTYLNIMYPQRKDFVDKCGNSYGKTKDSFLYCGPFEIKDWTASQKIILDKNQNYWDKNSVKLANVTFDFIRNENDRESKIKNGTVDAAQCYNFKYEVSDANKHKISFVSQTEPTTYFNFFNQKDNLFSNIKVRQAFILAVDREDYIKRLSSNNLISAYSFTPPDVQVDKDKLYNNISDEPVSKLTKNNNNCKDLLISGLKELKMDTDTSKLTINCISLGTDDISRRNEDLIKYMYEKNLGITIKVQYLGLSDYESKLSDGSFQIACGAICNSQFNDPESMLNIWTPDQSLYHTGYSSSDFNNLYNKADKADAGSRKDLLTNAEDQLICKDAIVSPIAYGKKTLAYYDYVKGVMYPMYGADIDLKYAYTMGRESGSTVNKK